MIYRLKHKDGLGKENFKKIKLVLRLIGHYTKYIHVCIQISHFELKLD